MFAKQRILEQFMPAVSSLVVSGTSSKSTITVTPVNDAPNTIELLSTTLLENMAGASIVNLAIGIADFGQFRSRFGKPKLLFS